MRRIILAAICIIAVAACAERRPPTFAFTELGFPGAETTVAVGINAAGHVAGWYRKGDRTSGFIYQDGAYTSIDYPGAALTQVYGIAHNGEIVGSYRKPDETQQFEGHPVAYHGFLRTSAGEFLDVSHPDHKYSMAQRILPGGTVVGCYHDDDFTSMRGIAIRREAIMPSAPAATAVAVVDTPSSMSTGGTADGAKVVGFVMNSGQAYTIDRGVLTTFGAPDATRTEAWDINPSGVVVGTYDDSASVSHGYVLENGRFTTIDFPGAKSTVTLGINARGDIVGGYEGADGQRRGYLAVRK